MYYFSGSFLQLPILPVRVNLFRKRILTSIYQLIALYSQKHSNLLLEEK